MEDVEKLFSKTSINWEMLTYEKLFPNAYNKGFKAYFFLHFICEKQ